MSWGHLWTCRHPYLTLQGLNFCTELLHLWDCFCIGIQPLVPPPQSSGSLLLQPCPFSRSFLAPGGSPGHDQHTALPPAQPHWELQGCRARPPALPPALPCPHEAHQPLPLRPVAVVGVGVAFLGEFVEEDRGIEVFAAHLCELQGSLAGDVGLQRAARLQEAVDLAKQAARPLQPTGRASGEAWSFLEALGPFPWKETCLGARGAAGREVDLSPLWWRPAVPP